MTDLEPLPPTEGVELFLEHREPSVRPTTLENAKHRLSVFQEWCEEEDIENLNELTGRKLAQFVSWRRSDVAPITLQKQLSSVRQALRYWADLEAVPNGMAEKLHAPDLPDGAESREEHIEADHAHSVLDALEKHHYASRDHVLFLILWRTGMRRSALRSIDVDDLDHEEHAIQLRHRPETDTWLKNGTHSERDVYLGPEWFKPVEEHLDHPDRNRVTDDHGRTPLLTSRQGRPTGDTIYMWTCKVTHPCRFGPCPHNRDELECEALTTDGHPSQCPSAKSPHEVRRGAITNHLNEDTQPEVVSERMDVSLEVLYQHYDARTEREKMNVRKKGLPQ